MELKKPKCSDCDVELVNAETCPSCSREFTSGILGEFSAIYKFNPKKKLEEKAPSKIRKSKNLQVVDDFDSSGESTPFKIKR